MATKEDATTTKAAPAKAAAKDTTAAEPKTETPAEDERVSTCVVDDGRGFHVGNAVNGKVCSYHAMHYDANGNRR